MPRQGQGWSPFQRFCAAVTSLVIVLASSAPAGAQPADAPDEIRINGDRLSGFVLPVEPLEANLEMSALRGWAWSVDDTRRLVLQQDVTIRVGDQVFKGPSAVVWINRIPSADGLVNQLAVFFETVGNPSRRAGLGAEGNDLLLTASTRGDVKLSVADLERRVPRRFNLLRQAETRLAVYLRRLRLESDRNDVFLATQPQHEVPTPPDEFVPIPGGRVTRRDEALPVKTPLPGTVDERLPLLAPRGVVRYSAGRLEFESGATENVILALDGLVVEYVTEDGQEDWSRLTLVAERGVIFTDPGRSDELARGELNADSVRGVYLEGNVHITAEEGDYLARAPRVYYDFESGEAIMMDAVLRTYARDTNVPIYARAREMRQVAANQWQADRVRVSTSEFFTPHLSLGAERAVVTRRPVDAEPGRRETYIESDGNTLRAGDVALFGWPHFKGTVQEPPLKDISLGAQTNDGIVILTRWDLYTLLGREAPDGHEAMLLAEGFTDRGAALGLEYGYRTVDGHGDLDLYLMYDTGTDRTSSGGEVEQDGFRGVALWEQDLQIHPAWRFQAQVAYISDETFISARRERDFLDRREYETALYLNNVDDNASFNVLAKYSLNDFLSNDYLLASRQYTVDRLPELAYRRYGDRLFDAVTWSSDTRLTRMRFVFQDTTANEIGVPGIAFGLPGNDNIGDSLRAQGYDDNWVTRFDTRHDFEAPFSWGDVRVTPFGTARFTAYSDSFESFNGSTEDTRAYGSAGVRLWTQLHHVDNSVSNEVLDLNRIRHVIEPSAVFWGSVSDFEFGDLPIYDQDVEGIGQGIAMRAGVRNTWQTQRGGPGRWRSVDWLTIDANVVLSDNTIALSPTPQFFDYRPELSSFGDQVNSTQSWLLSDSVSLIGTQIYDLENAVFARASVGAEISHTPDLRTYVEYRYIDASQNELLGIGWDYQMSKKYRLQFTPQWDFRDNQFRSVALTVTRAFPDYNILFQVSRDEIRDVTSVGASLQLAEF